MRERQRALGEQGDSVIEGRDIGVVVAPHAEVKVWLVADPAVRARAAHAGARRDRGRRARRPSCGARDERDASTRIGRRTRSRSTRRDLTSTR